MRRILILALALAALAFPATAQDFDLISDLPDDFASIDTLPKPEVRNSVHMLGVRYGVNLGTVNSNPPIGESYKLTLNNVSVLYTYYHTLWGYMSNFGLQTGIKMGYEGYNSEYAPQFGEVCKMVEIPLISQFHIDFSRFRLIANLGTYGGYRLSTDREGGFTQYDQRYDYGIIGGGGLAVVFKPFELQIEGNYKYSFASMYHTNRNSDLYWILTYPRVIMISASLFVHLW